MVMALKFIYLSIKNFQNLFVYNVIAKALKEELDSAVAKFTTNGTAALNSIY
jgi:hypothetical protein